MHRVGLGRVGSIGDPGGDIVSAFPLSGMLHHYFMNRVPMHLIDAFTVVLLDELLSEFS